MSTRAAIARPTSNEGEAISFAGTYHHWDGYPTGLGSTLFELYRGHFNRDLDAMLKFLIDDHPGGWSTINGKDLSLPPGFTEMKSGVPSDPCAVEGCQYGAFQHAPGQYQKVKHTYVPKPLPPECYCHGERSEEGWVVTQENASGSGCEYVYVLKQTPDGAVMLILSSYTDIGSPTGEKDQKMIGFFGAGDDNAEWKPIAVVGLDREDEPDWKKIEEAA